MTHAVTWTLTAIEDLTRVFAATADTVSARTEAEYIDYTLRRTPNDMGESRDPGFRVWYTDAIGVHYFVDDAAETVLVIADAPSRRR